MARRLIITAKKINNFDVQFQVLTTAGCDPMSLGALFPTFRQIVVSFVFRSNCTTFQKNLILLGAPGFGVFFVSLRY